MARRRSGKPTGDEGATPNGGATIGHEAELWAMADALRGSMARELQAAIADAIRATGKLDDFEVDALVRAGVMKKVHLRHPRYREEAACGQPYPTLLTDDRDCATCGRCRRIGMASAAKVESD